MYNPSAVREIHQGISERSFESFRNRPAPGAMPGASSREEMSVSKRPAGEEHLR
ncbi:MAG: hypothetical protein QF714_10145 [Dehalococcoidia bacterium]|nr:hypothetical protein [Dehalococcoidia bacterium]MDP6228041.1 hypothetical protein [Dehalococcoidia bacterium]MDP7085201.1 hypothetical protein [Dehalococcoidia bacterium]MDP7200556.1 hypothetical protein [Dehalococcoidia bacterium]HJN86809.1 hypothetical protein [Dehalococcoidia bacterium]